MGDLFEVVTPLHTATARDYLSRMNDDKVEAMSVAQRYDRAYWDGDRRYGYGGYRYLPGRWKPVAEALIERYELSNESSIIDIGCGKAFLLYEIQELIPGARLVGLDVSQHALDQAHGAFRGELILGRAEEPLPYAAEAFDFAFSLATLHNLRIFEAKFALEEMSRVSGQQFVMVESYRTNAELFNLECWALTARTFLDPEEWAWLFGASSFSGDFEFIYFD